MEMFEVLVNALESMNVMMHHVSHRDIEMALNNYETNH